MKNFLKILLLFCVTPAFCSNLSNQNVSSSPDIMTFLKGTLGSQAEWKEFFGDYGSAERKKRYAARSGNFKGIKSIKKNSLEANTIAIDNWFLYLVILASMGKSAWEGYKMYKVLKPKALVVAANVLGLAITNVIAYYLYTILPIVSGSPFIVFIALACLVWFGIYKLYYKVTPCMFASKDTKTFWTCLKENILFYEVKVEKK